MTEVIIGVGSNIDPWTHIAEARERIANLHKVVAVSSLRETEPIGFRDQPNFMNGVILIETDLPYNDVNQGLKDLERALGRVRVGRKDGPRVIDLDILVWDRKVMEPNLHRFHFYEEAIREILPDFRNP